MTSVSGTCEPQYEPVRAALAKLIEAGDDIGASAAVIHEGRFVADVWGGHLDEARTVPWQRDTITNVYSTTKTMTNLCALMLADQGLIDVDATVGSYWPEFKANGKDGVLVRHLLAHTSGVAGWAEPITPDELYDWERATSLLAAQAPWWEPGTQSGYHAITQGHLVGEVVRRVTGQSVGTWFRENIAEPLGADFHIGTPPQFDERVAPLIPPAGDLTQLIEGALPGTMTARAFLNPPLPKDSSFTIGWRRAEIPAANGHGNARSVALAQSIVSGRGESHGKRFLSADGVERIFREQSYGPDLVVFLPIRFGIGYGLPSPEIPFANQHTCFWGGLGGSLVVNDVENSLTIAYVMNKMSGGTMGDLRGAAVARAAYKAFYTGA